jgi:hypothetical protein
MNITRIILIKSFVKPFYRRHAGLFVFAFILLFGAVGMVDGAGLMAFHLSLVQSILKNAGILLVVLFIWSLYAKKTTQFVINILRSPEFSFLQILSRIDSKKLLGLLVWVQFLLFLPIIFYTIIIFVVCIYLHSSYISFGVILLYISAVILLSAWLYLNTVQNLTNKTPVPEVKIPLKTQTTSYWFLFIRYIARHKKLLFTGIKIYSCTTLYLMVVNQLRITYDLSMIILFFSIGILGHGMLIYQLRDMEETRLSFYRTIPNSLPKRFVQYGLIYFVLLLPEFISIVSLTPYYLHYKDALLLILLSYGIILFLNSVLFIQFFAIKHYLKIILCTFLLIYFCVLTFSVAWLCIFLLISSVAIFFRRYYLFER